MAKKITKTATVADARKLALKTAAADKAKLAKTAKAAKPVVAKKAAKPAPKPVQQKAAHGEKSSIIFALAIRKEGMTAAEIKEATGWKSVSAKAIADRFSVTWSNYNIKHGEITKPYKVVAVERKDGVAAYRFA